MVSLYSEVDQHLNRESSGVLNVCRYQGHNGEAIIAINVTAIKSVVAMIPFKHTLEDYSQFFLMEQMGLEMGMLGGLEERMQD